MNVVNLDTWEDFEHEISNKDEELLQLKKKREKEKFAYTSNFLFRGHNSAEWNLSTTLDRFSDNKFTLNDYYRFIFAVKPQIETFTKKSWNIINSKEFDKWLEDNEHDLFMASKIPAYEYLVYIRHHGFPSPLLDWTRSPYIAAYFAFRKHNPNVENVSIYMYQEFIGGGGKPFSSIRPYITLLGHYVTAHERHFLQQSSYTICTVSNSSDGKCYYEPHENFVELNSTESDVLWKYNIPSSERIKVLQKLDRFNINAFSLFGNEESLMETVSIREHTIRD